MSRVGQQPIELPQGVTVKIADDNVVTVSGPKGELIRALHPEMSVQQTDGRIVVSRPSDTKRHMSLHGLTRTLIANMVIGVSEGYEKELEVKGVGYRAEMKGTSLELRVGFSHPVIYDPPEGVELEVDTSRQRLEDNMPVIPVIVRGIDKEAVGQAAAEIRAVRKVEPFRGKGIRYRDEHVRRKAGKAGKIGALP
ncbi:MAG: 50S ribosomal protein L6 [Armatimonadota bacterium]